MGKKTNIRVFEMEHSTLRYDFDKSILLCMSKQEMNKKLWVKKLNDTGYISNIIEDRNKYYIACESSDTDANGQLLAIYKGNGSTNWFIPGKSFLQIIFGGYLYFIFVDGDERYYLLKVDRKNGGTRWHHIVSQDLFEYRFTRNKIFLNYSSGKKETLSIKTGQLLE